MTLLDALVKVTQTPPVVAIPGARLVHFAFAEGTSAYLSELELEELLPLLEE